MENQPADNARQYIRDRTLFLSRISTSTRGTLSHHNGSGGFLASASAACSASSSSNITKALVGLVEAGLMGRRVAETDFRKVT